MKSRYLSTCPRCGEVGYERLKSHSHCVNCNYDDQSDLSSDEFLALPGWVDDYLKKLEPSNDAQLLEEDFEELEMTEAG